MNNYDEKKIEKVKEFIEDNIDQIENNQFELLYGIAYTYLEGKTGIFTKVLNDAGIDPLPHLTEIPGYYLAWTDTKYFEIPNNVQLISEFAFAFTEIKTQLIPSNIKVISEDAFYACSKLQEVEIEEGCEEIAKYAFDGCTKLRTIYLPKSIKLLGKGLFKYNPNLIISYAGTYEDWIMINKDKDFTEKAIIRLIAKDMDRYIS